MADMKGFARRIRVRGQQIEEGVNRIVRTVGVVVDTNLVQGTPVDTGRARSNWQVQIGSPTRSEIAAYAPGFDGSTEGENTRAAIEQGKAVIQTRQPGQDIFISNNLPYIGRLNEGYSSQAPSGFVQEAILKAAQVVRQRRVFRDGN